MTNSKTTKRALLTSCMSILLCVAMLLGTTFAWFTDSVSSANNKIVAGNLKVDLLMADASGTYGSIANKDAAIFGAEDSLYAQNNPANTLWEPGKTQVVYLGVQNKGNLALKYNIILDIKGDLAGALEYAVIDGAEAKDSSSATSWTDIKNIENAQVDNVAEGSIVVAENGTLDEIRKGIKDETDYFALAVHMKEEAGNEYMDKDITIDVSVRATQVEAEEDSFDNKYDADADYAIYVSNADELKNALASGSKVVLANDIDLDDQEWTPIGTKEAPYSGTFDGNGKTISGLRISSGDYAGFFGYVSNATIKNVTVSGVDVSGGERMGALVGQINGNTVVENCTVSGSVIGSDSNTGGMIGEIINGTVQLTNLKNEADVSNTKSSNSRAGGIVGQVTTNANVTLKNCVNNGEVTTDNGYAGGIVSAYQSGTLTIDNCVNNGTLDGQYEGNMLGWYTSVTSITISTESNKFDMNAIGCVDIAISSNMSLYGKNYFVNRMSALTGVTDTKQEFADIFAADKIGTSPKALWDKLMAFYAHAATTNPNFAGYPKTYWEMFNKSSVGYSEPDWNSYFESYNAQCDDGNKLEKSEFSSASWREHIVYLAPEA